MHVQRREVMTERLKGVWPLALAVGVIAFVYLELSLNFTFHWGDRREPRQRSVTAE